MRTFLTGLITLLVLSAAGQDCAALQESDAAIQSGSLVASCEVVAPEPPAISLADAPDDIKAFADRLKSAEEPWQRIAATVDLCVLYLKIVGDRRFPVLEQIQGYRGRIAGHLQKELREWKREMIRETRRNGGDQESAYQLSADKKNTWEPGEEHSAAFHSAVIDPHWHLLAEFSGGAAPFDYHATGLHGATGHFLRGGAPGGQLWDHGLELVSLIEAILHPDFWSVAGGPGRAVYYQPLRILVVRATLEVHEDLTDLLERLR